MAVQNLKVSAVRTVTREELQRELAAGEAIKLVMASSAWGFRAKHLPGSLHFDAPSQMFAALGLDDAIVAYCSNVDCHASLATVRALIEHGYRNVRHYAGGLIDWEEAGLPLEGEWTTPSPSSTPGEA